MSKINKLLSKKTIYLTLAITFILILIFVLLKKGTFSLENNGVSISIKCPTTAIAGEKVDCKVNMTLSNGTVIEGFKANYDIDKTVEVESFNSGFTCSDTATNCIVETTENGFAVGKIGGIATDDKWSGTITLKMPTNVTSSADVKIGLKSIDLSNNSDESLTYSDISTTITVKNNYDIIFDQSLTVDKEKKIIKKIAVGTKYQELENKIVTNGAVSFTSKGKDVTKTNAIKTGDIVKINTGSATVEYTLSVLGDITGDGIIEINDVSKLYRYYRGRTDMTDAYIAACEVTGDGIIEINDVSKLYRYYRGRITSLEVVK